MRSILNLVLLLSLLGLSSAGSARRGGRRSSDFVERCKTNAECIRSHQPLLRPARRIPKSDSRTLVDRTVYTSPFSFTDPGLYTVSVDTNGTYLVSITGGSGGDGGVTGDPWPGGVAATVQAEFYLTTDQTFLMVVGGAGMPGVSTNGGGGGGGGGSFIYTPGNSLLIAAAGGGGAGNAQAGEEGSTGTSGVSGAYGGQGGMLGLGGGAGTGSDIGGGGAGFNGSGGTTSGAGNGVGGTSRPAWTGGYNQYASGGYGGGGSGSSDSGGGGAGYSGGGGGGNTSGGGGGGSYIDDTLAQQITSGVATHYGNGQITVTLAP